MNELDPRSYYTRQRDELAGQLDRIAARDRQYGRTRLALFLVASLCFLLGGVSLPVPVVWFSLGIAAVVAFILVAGKHERIADERVEVRHRKEWHQHALARLDRRWQELPVHRCDVPPEHRAVAADLDLFGRASLFQLIDQTGTPEGKRTLVRWLLEPADPETLVARQAAVQELAPLRTLREELALRCRLLSAGLAGPRQFVSWAESPPWYGKRRAVLIASRVLPLLLVGGLAVWLTTGAGWAFNAALLLIVVNLGICLGCVGSIHTIFNQVSTRHGEARQYRDLFHTLETATFQSPRLAELRGTVGDRTHGAASAMGQLSRTMSLAALRHAGLLSIGHVLLQITLLWDLHVNYLLDRWKQRHGAFVGAWFQALAEFEALASLAVLAHDQPLWTYPEVTPADQQLSARQLGHPLLSDAHRVANDVEVGPPGSVLLVTGSNMSGKSTLLRAIGLNVVLAQAGGPVCAAHLRLPPVTITTSMRVHDSLEDGVSFYMAELKRLKQIVDLAASYQPRSDRKLLYLLDEILQGTNSRERHIAVCRVVAHLVEHGAIGAITTHDLDLATSQPLDGAVRPVHFRETLHEDEGRPMTFDYQMRPGVATTTNALKLLSLVGLH